MQNLNMLGQIVKEEYASEAVEKIKVCVTLILDFKVIFAI